MACGQNLLKSNLNIWYCSTKCVAELTEAAGRGEHRPEQGTGHGKARRAKEERKSGRGHQMGERHHEGADPGKR